MKEFDNNILENSKELKRMPFIVPEGYFDKLKSEVRKCAEPQVVRVSLWRRLAPYAGIAAMFLFILALGNIFIKGNHTDEAASIYELAGAYEDIMVFNDRATDLSLYYIENEDMKATALNDDDIIEYLIYIGATEQYIEYNNE